MPATQFVVKPEYSPNTDVSYETRLFCIFLFCILSFVLLPGVLYLGGHVFYLCVLFLDTLALSDFFVKAMMCVYTFMAICIYFYYLYFDYNVFLSRTETNFSSSTKLSATGQMERVINHAGNAVRYQAR